MRNLNLSPNKQSHEFWQQTDSMRPSWNVRLKYDVSLNNYYYRKWQYQTKPSYHAHLQSIIFQVTYKSLLIWNDILPKCAHVCTHLAVILSNIRVSNFLFNCLKLHGASSAPIYICRSWSEIYLLPVF